MKLREAAQQALEAMEKNTKHLPLHFDNYFEAMNALRAALTEPQSTHSADCWKWHHECAIAKIERESKHE